MTAARPARKGMSEDKRRAVNFYLMTAPWLIVFLALSLYPLCYGFYLSLTNLMGFNWDKLKFKGFDQYVKVLTDGQAIPALGRTLYFALMSVPTGMFVAFLLAILLNNNIRGRNLFRTVFYLPSIVPAITTIIMWKNILLTGNGGLFDQVVRALGFRSIAWLGYDAVRLSMLMMMTWGAGGGILIYLAGLQGIPAELYESASIDGARWGAKFRYITIPMMTPVLFFQFLMGVIGSLQIYTQPILIAGDQLMTRPIAPIYMYNVHAFQQIFGAGRYAYGMAALWVMFAVILVLAIVIFTTRKLWVYEES